MSQTWLARSKRFSEPRFRIGALLAMVSLTTAIWPARLAAQDGAADLATGVEMWADFVESAPRPEERAKYLSETAEHLAAGIDACRKQVSLKRPPKFDLLWAELCLTELYLETDRPQDACELLERTPVGLLELVVRNQAPKGDRDLSGKTYAAALHAYLGADRTDDATRIFKLLKPASDAEADIQRTKLVCETVKVRFSRQILESTNSGDRNRLAKTLKVFEQFHMLVAKNVADNLELLTWLARSYSQLGDGMERNQIPTRQSQKYFTLAGMAYGRVLKTLEETDRPIPLELTDQVDAATREQQLSSLEVVMATCHCRAGRFDDALDTLRQVLAKTPRNGIAQLEAARTLQLHGTTEGMRNSESGVARLQTAIEGEHSAGNDPDSERLIWGWKRIAHVAAKNPEEFGQDVFFDASYNLAYARFMQARLSRGVAQHKLLVQSVDDVLQAARAHPELGGEKWRHRFDLLLRHITKTQGKLTTLDEALKK